MRLKYKRYLPFSITNYSKLDTKHGFQVKIRIQSKQSINCDNYNVKIANQSIFIKCLKLPSFEHFRDFQEIEAYSLKDVGRVLFGGNNAPYIRKSMKVAIFLPRCAKPGRSRAKRGAQSTRIQRMARNATYVIFGRTDLSKYANIMNRP